ncbi:MAG TPA: DUF5658 family protein [Chthonomonadales bacterium]|nr:DUF5658 family protein [Chthonomonadales bacterium]
MRISRESWIIAAIGAADLVSTILFIRHHGAQEANPVFRHYWSMGILAFVAAKTICVVGPLFVLEWARKRSPRFVSMALRGAIAGYLILYGVGFVRLNGAPSTEARADGIARQQVQYYGPFRKQRLAGFPSGWRAMGAQFRPQFMRAPFVLATSRQAALPKRHPSLWNAY